MNKITAEEFDRFSIGVDNPAIEAILALKINEGVKVGYDEWTFNTNLMAHIRGKIKVHNLKMKFKYRRINDGKSFMILRIK